MIATSFRRLTRPFRLALVCGAAVLCLPTQGFAGPIEIANINIVSVAGLPRFLGMLDNGGAGAFARAAHQGNELARLADDLRDKAKADLASHGNGPSEGRGRGWAREQSERAFGASLRNGSHDSAGGGTSVPFSVSEPTTLALFGVGLIAAAMWAQRRVGTGRPSTR